MKKQDRQGARTPSDLERKYNLGSMSEQSGQNSEKLSQLTQALAQYTTETNARLKELEEKAGADLLKVYPVGSIYTSINNTDPTTLFGGTWELLAEGQLLVGVAEDETSENLISILQSYTTCYIWQRTA